MLSAILLAAAARATPAPAYARAGIDRIEITSSWGGLGKARWSKLVIVRRGGSFYVDGLDEGVAPADVDRLVSAINAPPLPAPLPQELIKADAWSIGRQADTAASDCAGAGAAIPSVRRMFRRAFASVKDRSRWIKSYYLKPLFWTDDYPQESVVVQFSDGSTMTAKSQSQEQYMLPFTVERDGKSTVTFSSNLPIAIAAINPSDVNTERLTGYGLLAAYGDDVCGQDADAITRAELRDYFPELAREVQKRPDVSKIFVGKNLDEISGVVNDRRFPSITMQFAAQSDSRTRAGMSALALRSINEARATLRRITAIPWIARRFTRHPQASMNIETDTAGSNWDIENLSTDGYPHVAAYISKHLKGAVKAIIWDSRHSEGDSWYLLANGDAISPDGRLVHRDGHVDPMK